MLHSAGPVVLLVLLAAVAFQAAVLNHHSGFVPSLNFGSGYNSHHVLQHVPQHAPAPAHHASSYGAGNEACAVIIGGAGRSSLFDYTRSILLGSG